MQGSREIVQSERRRGGSKTNGKVNQPNDREYSAELGQLLNVLVQYRNGDFSPRLPHTWTGAIGKMADVMNEILTSSERRASETARICRVVGKEGKLSRRFSLAGLGGGWAESEVEVGSKFSLTVPARYVTQQAEGVEEPVVLTAGVK